MEHTTEIVDWGNLIDGSQTMNWWIQNVGNTNVTLTLNVTAVPDGWVLTWNYTNSVLEPTQVESVEIQLTVPSNELGGTYNWTYIIGTEEAFL